MSEMRLFATLCVLGFTICACGGSDPSRTETPGSSRAEARESDTRESPAPRGTIASGQQVASETVDTRPVEFVLRSDLEAVLDAGLGRFLGRFQMAPEHESQEFVGHRLVAFTDAAGRLAYAGLSPGDVVVSVNTLPIGRPDQAFEVWQALRVANELRVEYFRGGERRWLVLPVVDSAADVPAVAVTNRDLRQNRVRNQ